MSQFVVICMFKQFMSEGWSTSMSRKMTIDKTGLKKKAVWKIIQESDECQELINQRKEAAIKTSRFPTGGTTWV